MRKRVLSLATIVALSPMCFAADSVEGMFKGGKASGQIRAFYINRDIDAATDYTRDALALGGKFGYETASLYGVSLGAMFYTTNKLDDKSAVATENERHSLMEAQVTVIQPSVKLISSSKLVTQL